MQPFFFSSINRKERRLQNRKSENLNKKSQLSHWPWPGKWSYKKLDWIGIGWDWRRSRLKGLKTLRQNETLAVGNLVRKSEFSGKIHRPARVNETQREKYPKKWDNEIVGQSKSCTSTFF